jgi:serine/threonine-protein kinase HipA
MSVPFKVLRAYLHLPDGTRRPFAHLISYGDVMRVAFDEDYIADPARPVLSFAYRDLDDEVSQQLMRDQRSDRVARLDGHWPAFFMNVLPEGHNRTRLALARGCAEDDEFELLAASGRDLMGALEVEPVSQPEGLPDAIVRWHIAAELDPRPEPVLEPVEDAASLPGVVIKFSAIRDGRRYTVRHRGQAGSYILKLPSATHLDLVESELTGYRLCTALDIDCAEAEIVRSAEVDVAEQIPFDHVLSVKRFDRAVTQDHDGNAVVRRVHFEELCQALNRPPMRKYTKDLRDYAAMLGMLQLLSDRRTRDLEDFVARFVAFILMGNCDAHLKNWGFVYPDGRRPRLAPVYDPVCVAALFKTGDPL